MEKGKTSPLVKPYLGSILYQRPVKVDALMFSSEAKNEHFTNERVESSRRPGLFS